MSSNPVTYQEGSGRVGGVSVSYHTTRVSTLVRGLWRGEMTL